MATNEFFFSLMTRMYLTALKSPPDGDALAGQAMAWFEHLHNYEDGTLDAAFKMASRQAEFGSLPTLNLIFKCLNAIATQGMPNEAEALKIAMWYASEMMQVVDAADLSKGYLTTMSRSWRSGDKPKTVFHELQEWTPPDVHPLIRLLAEDMGIATLHKANPDNVMEMNTLRSQFSKAYMARITSDRIAADVAELAPKTDNPALEAAKRVRRINAPTTTD